VREDNQQLINVSLPSESIAVAKIPTQLWCLTLADVLLRLTA
jgi:hypothetical protein